MTELAKGSEILVTGGAGYVGSHCCQYLSKKGYRPVVVDNLDRGHRWAVQWGPFYQGDLRDSVFLEKVFSQHQFKAVFHFAAFAYVGESTRDPLMYFENNVGSTLSLLAAMKKAKVKQLVFSSTCATYGEPKNIPIDESSPQNPVNPYGRSKLMVETILKDVSAYEQLKVVCLRYFNAAGADPEGKIGEDHQPETHLIPLAIEAAYQKTAVTIFGNDYKTRDGSCLRDYIHVSDLASAHLLALQWLEQKPASTFEYFNLGTGQGHSVFEIIDAVEKMSDHGIRRIKGARREGDPAELVASGDKAERLLGWKPEFSDLSTIVRTADQWYRQHTLEKKI